MNVQRSLQPEDVSGCSTFVSIFSMRSSLGIDILFHPLNTCCVTPVNWCYFVPLMYPFCQVAEGAKAAGAARIIGVDIDPFKIEQGINIQEQDFLVLE